MSKQVALLIANGFEEGEVTVIVDILRRLEVTVDLISTEEGLQVVSYHGIPYTADCLLNNALPLYPMLVMAGGPNGAKSLGNNSKVISFVQKHKQAKSFIATFCSAGAHIMAKNGLWGTTPYTTSGDNFKLYPNDGVYTDKDIIIKDNFISGRGFGLVFEFALTLAILLGVEADKVDFQADHIYFRYWTSKEVETYRL